jgi:hypothetical protein
VSEVEYCTPEDVYKLAAASDSLVRRAMLVASVDTVGHDLEVGGHGCSTDDPLEFRLEPGGALPSPFTAGTIYYAKPVTDSDDLLQVAAAPGGPAIVITTAGTPPFSIVPSVRPIIHGAIQSVSRWIEDRIPAHAVPLSVDTNGNYPPAIRQMCAVLSAEQTLAILGQYSTLLAAQADQMRANAKMMLDGLPSRQIPLQRGVTPVFGNSHGPHHRSLLP